MENAPDSTAEHGDFASRHLELKGGQGLQTLPSWTSGIEGRLRGRVPLLARLRLTGEPRLGAVGVGIRSYEVVDACCA